jgi:hypothetical protein
MQTETVVVDDAQARALYRKYREHQHYAQPIDWEIQRTYQLIAQGRIVIKAIDSIVAAGLNDERLPKLAIVRADAEECFWLPTRGGGGAFAMTNSWARDREHQSRRIVIAEGTWPEQSRSRNSYRAVAPLIPIHLRPKRGLQNYHVLWEAEWRPAPPLDPLLLRRIGISDLWVVCAAWDLTPVERTALAPRINALH